MRDLETAPLCSGSEPTRTETGTRALTFGGDPAFQRVLLERVTAYFVTTGQRPRDCWQMYTKTAILLAAFAGLYALLVFGARTWIEGVPLAVLLGLCAAGLGLNVQHDGGQQAQPGDPEQRGPREKWYADFPQKRSVMVVGFRSQVDLEVTEHVPDHEQQQHDARDGHDDFFADRS